MMVQKSIGTTSRKPIRPNFEEKKWAKERGKQILLDPILIILNICQVYVLFYRKIWTIALNKSGSEVSQLSYKIYPALLN